ncbi:MULTISPECIES: hypothetical protein [unclassified Thioalkalivibrio]|uniref:hypothetical protein n=1 Tax=unclassified Thioalkalivibrio TaxID=2621013 RepID=UPI000361D0A3|nr:MULTISPECIES: hypothetical protein [unclassified Thioalkalivibrio]
MGFRVSRLDLLLVALALLFFQGCAGMQPFMTAEDQIETAVEEGHYQRALELLDEYEPEPANEWATRREEIEVLAQEAADQAMKDARAVSAEGAVAEALGILEDADSRLPESEERTRFMDQLERQRQVGLRTLQQRHDILEARNLVEQLRLLEIMRPLVQETNQLPADPDALNERAPTLAENLERYAEDSEGQERLELLRLAQDLSPASERATRIRELNEELRTREEDEDREKEAERLSAINAQLRQALEAGELQRASQWCRSGDLQLDEDASDPDQAAQRARISLCEEWRAQRDARAEQLLEEGRRQYTAGQIQEAVNTWEEGLAMAPNHSGLATARERALRVLERLDTLRIPEAPMPVGPDGAPLPESDAEDAPETDAEDTEE